MNAMRRLKRSVAKANMKRAGFRHVNRNMQTAPWHDYLRMKEIRTAGRGRRDQEA